MTGYMLAVLSRHSVWEWRWLASEEAMTGYMLAVLRARHIWRNCPNHKFPRVRTHSKKLPQPRIPDHTCKHFIKWLAPGTKGHCASRKASRALIDGTTLLCWIISNATQHAILISGWVNRVPAKLLVDTGSAVAIVSRNVQNKKRTSAATVGWSSHHC